MIRVNKILILSSLFVLMAGAITGQTGWPRFNWDQIEIATVEGQVATAASSLSGEWNTSFLFTSTQLTAGNLVFNVDQTVGAGQDDYVLTYDHSTGEIGLETAGAGGGMTSFTLSGDGGTNQTINDGNTLEIAGGTGVITTGSATDILTAALNFSELAVELDVDDVDRFVLWDGTTGLEEIATEAVVGEWVQDKIGTMLSGNTETNISVTYDDANNEIDFVATDNDTQLSQEQVQDYIGTMVSGNTETNISVTYDDVNNEFDFVATNTQLSQEQVEDYIGGMLSGNTETNISVTYQDLDGTIDFVATDNDTQLSQEQVQDYIGTMLSGNTETNISVTYDDVGNEIDFSVSTETIQDIVGGMVSGNTESGISVTYQDLDGTLDFSVSVTGGSMDSWFLDDTYTTSTEIGDGETVVFADGAGIDLTRSGNTITATQDYGELSALTGFSLLDRIPIWDSSEGGEKYKYFAPTEFLVMDQEASGRVIFDNRGTNPTATSGATFFDTDDDALKVYDGSTWGVMLHSGMYEHGTTGSTTTGSSGNVVVSHGLGVVPTYINANISATTVGYNVEVQSATTTSITFKVTEGDGTVCNTCSLDDLYYIFIK